MILFTYIIYNNRNYSSVPDPKNDECQPYQRDPIKLQWRLLGSTEVFIVVTEEIENHVALFFFYQI